MQGRVCRLAFFNRKKSIAIKVTPDLREYPPGKNSYPCRFKGKPANYISLESLINEDFGKNMNCRFLQFHKRKSQTTTKMTICRSIELIGYQIQGIG